MALLTRTDLPGVATGALVVVGCAIYALHGLGLGLGLDLGAEKLFQAVPGAEGPSSTYTVQVAALAAWFALEGLGILALVSFLEGSPGRENYAEEFAKLRTLPKKLIHNNVQSRFAKKLFSWKSPAPAVAHRGPRAAGPQKLSFQSSVQNTKASYQSANSRVERARKARSIPLPTISPPATCPIEPEQESREKRAKEIAERKAFLRNFWYAAALSENVGDKPVPVQVLGMKLVLFRGKDGKVNCLRDSCPHRSAPLSTGSIANIKGHDCLVCPYHGWALDESGCIQDVPSEEEGHWPRTQQLETYVIEERGGFIWLFYEGPKGNRLPADERPPIPCIAELEDPDWIPVFGELEFECGHHAVFENAIDMAHIHYLHKDSFGNDEKPDVMNMEGTTDAFGVTTTFDIHNKPVSPLWNFTAVESVPVVAKAMLPSTSMIKIQLGMGIEFITFVCTVPISEDRCVNRFALLRNFLPWAPEVWEPWARKAMHKILGEDKVMVEQLRPEETLREISVRADLPQILFRRLRQEYIDMGYGYTHRSYDDNRRLP